MNSLFGISAVTPLVNSSNTGAITPSDSLLAAELSLSVPDLFAGTATLVDLSGAGQLLSAAANFENQLLALRPGTTTSGGGQNFGTDFASLAAEAQNFVDAYNNFQSAITNISSTVSLPGDSLVGAASLIDSLNTQAQAGFSNGTSSLTTLAQIGIAFHPSQWPGGAGSLSINLSTLQSAFNADAAGAFSLLSGAANAFSGVAGSFITQGGSQSSIAELTQAAIVAQMLNNDLFSQAQTNDNLGTLLGIESLTGTTSLPQVILAMNEYTLVSGLLA